MGRPGAVAEQWKAVHNGGGSEREGRLRRAPEGVRGNDGEQVPRLGVSGIPIVPSNVTTAVDDDEVARGGQSAYARGRHADCLE